MNSARTTVFDTSEASKADILVTAAMSGLSAICQFELAMILLSQRMAEMRAANAASFHRAECRQRAVPRVGGVECLGKAKALFERTV